MKRFAPESEGFKPITYVKALSKAGISSTVEMNELSEAKRQKMIDVIMDVEVFIPGRVVEFESEADFNKRGY